MGKMLAGAKAIRLDFIVSAIYGVDVFPVFYGHPSSLNQPTQLQLDVTRYKRDSVHKLLFVYMQPSDDSIFKASPVSRLKRTSAGMRDFS